MASIGIWILLGGMILDYRTYTLSLEEKIKYGALAIGTVFVFLYLFYGSIWVSIVFSSIGVLYLPYKKRELIKEKKKMLKQQFKEGLYALSSSISVGKSIEQAFIDARNDLRVVYWDQETYIIQEFETIARKVAMNETIENALIDLSQRADDEDIQNFTNVFLTAKRAGGNLVEIMKYTTATINEKIEIMDTIDVLITGKKYEQRILGLMVPLIIVYLRLFSAGFIDVMYQTGTGKIAMTVAMIIYLFSFVLSKFVVDIEV